MILRKAKWVLCWLVAAMLAAIAAFAEEPAQFRQSGSFSGGIATDNLLLSGIRFGRHNANTSAEFTRMVFDLEQANGQFASRHPVYSVTYREYPYRLVVRLQDVRFTGVSQVGSNPALPFSVVTRTDDTIKEVQVYLKGPSEFKVIEVDDPAKLAIDVRQLSHEVPPVYTVQLTGARNAGEAFAMVEQGNLPPGFEPDVLVLGDIVVVEQAFTNPAEAVEFETKLRELGYEPVINERRGDEIPAP